MTAVSHPRLVVCLLLLGLGANRPGSAAPLVEVSDQLAAGRRVLAGLGYTQPREDVMVSAKHGRAEELAVLQPATVEVSPDDGEGRVLKDQLKPQVKIAIDIWQTSAAAEAYVLQLIPDHLLVDIEDAPQGRMREGKSNLQEATVAGRPCYVVVKQAGLVGNNVTVFIEQHVAAAVPRHPQPQRQRNLQQALQADLLTDSTFAFYDLAGRFAVLSDQHGLTRRGGGLVKLIDANPLFTQGIPVPFDFGLAPERIHQLTVLNALRRGAVADGVSALLLVAQVPSQGKASFQLTDSPADGSLVKLPRQNVTGWRGAAAAAAADLPVVELVRKSDGAKQYFAFALYLPPRAFGAKYSDLNGLSRSVSLAFRFESNEPGVKPHAEQVPLELYRPPVVLVHGTYDNPRYCWQEGEPSLGGVSLLQRLVNAGYRFPEDAQPAVFAADYEGTQDRLGQYHSSGLQAFERQVPGPGGQLSSSAFLNNANVVYDCPQGIQRAIEVYRARRLAATQADVICHSLGGLVTRLYARGFPLNQAVPDAHYRNPDRCTGCWYHRPDNYQRGDLHRLITLCSTHKGSDIPGLLMPYERIVNDPSFTVGRLDKQLVEGLLYTVDWLTGRGGAFRNQEPNSPELNAIGPTPVPAHAVAATCTWQDIAQFDAFYRGRLNKIYLASPTKVMVEAFRRLGLPRSGARLEQSINLNADGDLILMTFWQAVFGNTPNDFTVRLESALGGLQGPHTTVLPGVLHGYAPRYPQVQVALQILLTGPETSFAANGFPPAGGPVRNQDG